MKKEKEKSIITTSDHQHRNSSASNLKTIFKKYIRRNKNENDNIAIFGDQFC